MVRKGHFIVNFAVIRLPVGAAEDVVDAHVYVAGMEGPARSVGSRNVAVGESLAYGAPHIR